MDNIDLHSLKVLNTIFETGSLSHTAAKLEVSQPAVSITLSKLRKHFDDPLFVRIGTRMQPTRQALGIIGNVQASIAAMEATLNYRIAFDPKTAHRNFTISMTDIGQIVMLPKLLNELEKRAPNCTLNVTKLTENTSRLLETGEVDLAVGFSPHIAAGLYQQVLFTENFVCLIRRKHPRIRNQIAKEQYRTESHMVVVTSVTSHLIIDKALDKEGVQRKVMIRVPNFLGLSAADRGNGLHMHAPKTGWIDFGRAPPNKGNACTIQAARLCGSPTLARTSSTRSRKPLVSRRNDESFQSAIMTGRAS